MHSIDLIKCLLYTRHGHLALSPSWWDLELHCSVPPPLRNWNGSP